MTTAAAAYLDLLGVHRSPPDRALLDRIVTAHNATIPFENLDPFTGVDPPTTSDGIAAKLVHARRGGWCFEHNRLLHDVLADLGYRVTPLVGRVRLGLAPADAPASRTHRFTLVDTIEGRFTVDAGFGSTVPTTALQLVAGPEQPTPQATYRYARVDHGGWVLQRRGSGGWADQYVFDLVPVPDVDFAMGSWYLAHHPGSHFRTGLVAARTTPRRRTTLDGTRLTVRTADGTAQRHDLTSPARVRDALEEHLGIDTGGVAGLEERLREVYFR
ncbi:arylamine N-acetyltransferase [Pseudonocardia sp. ICBG1293]|uniref:arylamine N-acetyltransferase family protein n=1 Tax=Pseudonocardia sp. ICBG1293 TaxID=2844382 RepID=UPI001CCB9594|nr:arylamine N-acetyltransferase [Pseudonocardia sp. ICBG1293]